ncbi:FAD-dependent oxidoreductase [Gordonibacter massiliensis (ex Traore et al. 2017)]|uniref:FAD-dependent oxidoreductase n=1 Tax=Gordonibacter massiliensis (ex Traore et al. 2017) TaxID=1841863 RepID=A0A842J9G6_9ACTN|nr:FAD-dependent oxidoreductase [Gordonibacter massiliensis (ex Traore et al. 2017)]MBC2888433.1 FAD-dependent oxidoreductase [Gordonibacter massiliensis (ex Traore et al. 2017)]
MSEKGLSRRAFLGFGATAAAAAAAVGITGCAPQAKGDASASGNASSAGGAATKFTPDFLTPPPVPTDVKDEKTCDVLVIGMGLAGTAAAKEAAEAGKKVIVLEKQPEDSYSVISMAGDFGVVGSKIQKDLGIEWAPKEDILNEFVKETGGRCDTWMTNYWYDHSGEDFDWFIENADYEVLKSTAANRETDKPNYIRPKCFPPQEGYNYKEEVYPYFHGTITTNPNMQWACQAAFEDAMKAGAELIYNAEGEQLIVEDGTVKGAYAKTKDGYLKVNAKAVVLCCGDYGANPEMRHYYAPWTEEFMGGVDDGRGQLMGIWAGGWMELGPHAPMTHHMGGSLGVDSFLQLNMEGKRFMNEDVPGQNIADEHTRQPVAKDPEMAEAGVKAWQIFDSKWPEQIDKMPDGHGYTTHFVSEEEAPNYETVLSGFGLGYTTAAMVEERTDVIANSLEELAEKTGLPYDTMKAEIERYNELCHKGVDEDFGKMSKRLFPVENPPYYACKFGNAGMLVMFGGLECDHDLHVTKDGTNDPIPGLFVAGNTMGRRLLVDYPVVVAGISLATALCFGRLAGKNAAASV